MSDYTLEDLAVWDEKITEIADNKLLKSSVSLQGNEIIYKEINWYNFINDFKLDFIPSFS